MRADRAPGATVGDNARGGAVLDTRQIAEIWKLLLDLFEPESFRAALPVLRQEWRNVLRDACSRTNSVLVRPDWLERMENLSLP